MFSNGSKRFSAQVCSLQAVRSLSVGPRGKRFNLLLLLGESRLEIFALLFDFAVLFEKLV